MPLPEPSCGLVLSFGYVWRRESQRGLNEGRKDRPCVIVLAVRTKDGKKRVTVVPITHTPPDATTPAIELPASIKSHLGLDHERSWIITGEFNQFTWPGFDLRPLKEDPSRFSYGYLPPKFFDTLIKAIKQNSLTQGVSRDTSPLLQ